MIYSAPLTRCTFLRRVNRFIAEVMLEGQVLCVHVKNTGRLGELLLPDAVGYLEKSGNPGRKTAYDLVAVEKDGRIVNIDSMLPNALAREWVSRGGLGPVENLCSEVVHGDSRFDLAYDREGVPGLIEVKGVTLFDESGLAIFPDAPTSRGVKHLHGLTEAAKSGMEAALIFVIMKEDARGLTPNTRTDPAFAKALAKARQAGVRIVCALCRVTLEGCEIIGSAPLILPDEGDLL